VAPARQYFPVVRSCTMIAIVPSRELSRAVAAGKRDAIGSSATLGEVWTATDGLADGRAVVGPVALAPPAQPPGRTTPHSAQATATIAGRRRTGTPEIVERELAGGSPALCSPATAPGRGYVADSSRSPWS